MRKSTKNRISIIVFIVVVTALLTWFITRALYSNINYFYYPKQVEQAQIGSQIKLGGYVVPGSLIKKEKTVDYTFEVMDDEAKIKVLYSGILPDLFREGQGVIVIGKLLSTSELEASEVLAKHDENYLPAELKGIEGPDIPHSFK